MEKVPSKQAIKILLIEDDSLTSEVIEESLLSVGYSVKTANSADQGQEIIEDWEPVLVITDQDMPGSSGIDLLCDLRKRENYVTVIFVSGRRDTKLVVRALQEGADDYIEKPFRVPELLARIEVALRNNEMHRELAKKNELLEAMVEVDDLTGLYNMRSIYDKVDKEIARGRRKSSGIAIVMMDMDHFKSVNDNNDHLFGSFVLAEVGAIIKDTIREYDFGARYGGDEFLMCLTEIDAEGAQKFCERLRKNVEAYSFNDGSRSIKLTCSIGVALMINEYNLDARELVRQADHALYESKEKGRNCTSLRTEFKDIPTKTSAS